MRIYSLRKLLLTCMLVLTLVACNYPGQASMPTPTATTILPTQTPEPSPTPLPPTDTPTEAPTASWTVPPPPVRPTATFTPVSTKAVQPKPGAKFMATFEGGSFVFWVSDKGTMVTPKQVRLRKASCQGGRTISESLTFEPPQFFSIQNGQFTIYWDTQATITGIFLSSLDARGSIELSVTKNDKTCNFGPVTWVASATP